VNYATGSTSSALDQRAGFTAQGKMTKLQMSKADRCLVVGTPDAAALNSSLYNTFNTQFNEDIILDGKLGRFAGFDIYEDEVIDSFTAGSLAGSPVVAAQPLNGATTLSLSGFTPGATGVLLAGDVISIEDVYSVAPLRYTSTGNLMTFVVQSNVDADGGGLATVTVSPSINWDSTSTLQNVDSRPGMGAAITRIASNTPNIAFTRSGLDIVCPPLPKLKTPECFVKYDEKYNIAIRLAAAADINESANLYRLDVLCGFAWHDQYAMRLYSQA